MGGCVGIRAGRALAAQAVEPGVEVGANARDPVHGAGEWLHLCARSGHAHPHRPAALAAGVLIPQGPRGIDGPGTDRMQE